MEKVGVRWSCKLLESLDIRFCSRTDQRLSFLVRFLFPFVPLNPLRNIFFVLQRTVVKQHMTLEKASQHFQTFGVFIGRDSQEHLGVNVCDVDYYIISHFNPRSHLFMFSVNPHTIVAVHVHSTMSVILYPVDLEFLPLVQGLGGKVVRIHKYSWSLFLLLPLLRKER